MAERVVLLIHQQAQGTAALETPGRRAFQQERTAIAKTGGKGGWRVWILTMRTGGWK